jgi:hypothetical protein
MIAANEAAFIKSLSIALFEPAKAALGSGLKCGNWNMFSDGRIYPSESRPTLVQHWKSGVHGFDFQIPASYSVSGYNFEEISPAGDPDPRWHVPGNWVGRLQMGGGSPADWAYLSTFEHDSALDWGAARSSPATLFPSTSVYYLVKRNVYAERKALVVERVLRTVLDGARDIWMWEYLFNVDTSPDPLGDQVRAAVYDHVLELNARVTALSPRRNRTARVGQVSFSFLGVNRP